MPATNAELLIELSDLYDENEGSLRRMFELRQQIRDCEIERDERGERINETYAELRARIIPKETTKK